MQTISILKSNIQNLRFFKEEKADKMELMNGNIVSRLPQNIRHLRKRQALSQEELAARIGLNRGNIASYENGTAEPKICNLLKFAHAFGISITDLTQKDLTQKETFDTAHHTYQANAQPLLDEAVVIFDKFAQRTAELSHVIESLHTCHQFKVKSMGELTKESRALNSHFEQMYELAAQTLVSHQELLEFIKCRIK